jgi:hypothetical protein
MRIEDEVTRLRTRLRRAGAAALQEGAAIRLRRTGRLPGGQRRAYDVGDVV